MHKTPTRPAPLSADGQAQASRSRSMRVLWYGGLSSKPLPTWIRLRPGPKGATLSLHPMNGAASAVQLDSKQINWSTLWSQRQAPLPLVVDLGEHGSLEIHDSVEWFNALEAVGQPTSWITRLQQSWSWLLMALLVSLALLFVFYRWGTPWPATQLARFVPLNMEQQVSQQYLSYLDENVLSPSRLPSQRQAQLRHEFRELLRAMPSDLPLYPNYKPQYRLEFRSGMPANAFALPGGTIVMTDDIVQHAQTMKLSDDALIGVLAHEIGHVANRHTSRGVIQQSVLQTGISLALGDLSSAISLSAASLTGLSYSRAHERESDCFAMSLMQAMGKPTQPMGELLLSLDQDHMHDTEAASPAPHAAPSGADRSTSGLQEWLQTHPDTRERARQLRDGQMRDCT